MRLSIIVTAIGLSWLSSGCPSNAATDAGATADAGAIDNDAGTPPACEVSTPQTCTGDRAVESLADLEALRECDVVDGSLSIVGGTLTDLAPLACLRRIEGDLTIGIETGEFSAATLEAGANTRGPVALTSLAGLGALEEVTGALRVVSTGEILGGLFGSAYPAGFSSFTAGPVELTSLDGLSSLVSLGALEIVSTFASSGSPPPGAFDVELALVDLSALDGVAVGDVQIVTRRSDPMPFPALTVQPGAAVQLSGQFSDLGSASWPSALSRLTLESRITDVELSAFTALVEVSETLTFRSTRLTTLIGFDDLTEVGTLVIADNFYLESLDGLEGVVSLSGLDIANNFNLRNFGGLAATSVSGDVSVRLNDAITEYLPPRVVYGFPVDAGLLLSAVEGSVTVPFGSLLLLENLRSVGGDLSVGSRGGAWLGNVTEVEGLQQLVSVGGDLTLQGLIATDLSGLSSLTNVGGTLSLIQNFDFQDPLGFHLSSVAGLNATLIVDELVLFNNLLDDVTDLPLAGSLSRLEIRAEQSLSNFSGLEGVTSVTSLAIENLPQLSSLSALSSLSVVDTLTINNLPLIPACEAEAFAAALGHPVGTGFRDGCTCSAGGAVCTPICAGDVSVNTQADLDALSSVTCSGNLWFGGDEFTTIDLPLLEVAGGIQIAESHNLTTLNLPALTEASQVSIFGVSALSEVHLPSLEDALSVQVECFSLDMGIAPLSILDLSSLQALGQLYVTDCADLPLCALEFDVAGIAPAETWLTSGLNESCTCDIDGDVNPGSCTP